VKSPNTIANARQLLGLLDRLLLVADRYEEIVRPDDAGLVREWEREWEERSEPWIADVVSVERTSGGRALRLTRLGHAHLPVLGCDGALHAFVGHPSQQTAS
jgi:hypothetical protein